MSIPYPFGFHFSDWLGYSSIFSSWIWDSGSDTKPHAGYRGRNQWSILASIVLATLGEKLQAGTTGLLGGYGLHDAASKFKLTQQYIGWLHEQLDRGLGTLLKTDEGYHVAVQYELL